MIQPWPMPFPDRIVHSSHRIDLKGATLRDNKRACKPERTSAGVTV